MKGKTKLVVFAKRDHDFFFQNYEGNVFNPPVKENVQVHPCSQKKTEREREREENELFSSFLISRTFHS